MSSITFYMITDTKTGRFSTGGTVPKWTNQDRGKVWRKIGHARTHITNAREYGARYSTGMNPDDWRIIEFTVPASAGTDKGTW